MQLEVGKYYRTRDGRKVGPMYETGIKEDNMAWSDGIGPGWTRSGTVYNYGEDGRDIIAEWQDDQQPDNMTAVQHLRNGVAILLEQGHYLEASKILFIMGRLK